MKRRAVALLLALACAWFAFQPMGLAQVIITNSGSSGAFTTPVTISGITGTNKALVVNNGTSTGNILEAQDNGTAVFTVADGGNVTQASNTTYQIGAAGGGGSSQGFTAAYNTGTLVTRVGGANVVTLLGTNDGAHGIMYTTGTALGLKIGTSTAGPLMTGANNILRDYMEDGAFTLTNTTAGAFVVISGLGAHKRLGGYVDFCVEAADASNDQVACGRSFWGAVDTTAGAGGEACTNLAVGTISAAASGSASSGTLVVTTDATTGTDLCNLRVTATSSLTPTTLRITYRVANNTQMVPTVTPQ